MSAEAIAAPITHFLHPQTESIAAVLPTLETAKHYEELEVLRALGKQHALLGNEDAALRLRDVALDPTCTDPADEITLTIMDRRLAEGNIIGGRVMLGQISPNMQAWGTLKLQKYGQPVGGAQLREYPLELYWPQYNPRQQGEIIDDLLHIGDYRRATYLALLMAPADSMPAEREAQRHAFLGIAHHQAEHGQAQEGINLLAELQAEAEAGLNESIAARMNLPEYPSNTADEAALAAHDAQYRERLETYNLASMHITALRAHQSVALAEKLLERAAFFGDDHRRTWRAAAGRLLGAVLRRKQR